MKLEIKGALTSPLKEECLVVFARSKGKNGSKSSGTALTNLPQELKQFLDDNLDQEEQLPEFNESLFFRSSNIGGAKHLLVVGLGDRTEEDSLREAGATAFKSLKSHKIDSAAFLFDSLATSKETKQGSLRALLEGAKLADYKFDDLKSQNETSKKPKEFRLAVYGDNLKGKQIQNVLTEAEAVADAVNFSRWLADMPANYMTPTRLAEEAQKKGKATPGLKVTVWDKARIKKERMGGLYGVSLGSDQEPRFIIMEYKGAAQSKKPICFVGKGLTFDTGGVSIKPSAGLEEMKYDMCGGASVIATMWAIARLKLKVNAIALIPSTENAINGSANKPGDVLTARNGKTFEVNNTDAEGRLILADALSYASELKPKCIVDAATLTGAMVMALGNTHTGFFTRDKSFRERIEAAAERSGEWVWPMPITDYHVADIKGTFADLSNISSFRGAGSATAAAFLEQFVEEGLTWAHFDIAGTAWNAGNRQSYHPKKGATGAIVRTFIELAKGK